MLEVVFSDSAAGSLSGAVGPKDTLWLQRGRWEKHEMIEGTPDDIFSFPLALDIGEIDEDGIGPKREAAFAHLMEIYPQQEAEAVQQSLAAARKNLAALLQRAASEPIRIWLSAMPDDACGVCWLMEQLQAAGLENLDVAYVPLPVFEERSDGTVVQYRGWGEVAPWQWARMTALGKKLPLNLMRAMAAYWKQLRKENAPVRAVLNGRLNSAPETVYDWYILQEIAAQEDEFREAMVIGKVLAQYPCVGDGWIAQRIEAFIRRGLLTPVTEASPGEAVYRRILRK